MAVYTPAEVRQEIRDVDPGVSTVSEFVSSTGPWTFDAGGDPNKAVEYAEFFFDVPAIANLARVAVAMSITVQEDHTIDVTLEDEELGGSVSVITFAPDGDAPQPAGRYGDDTNLVIFDCDDAAPNPYVTDPVTFDTVLGAPPLLGRWQADSGSIDAWYGQAHDASNMTHTVTDGFDIGPEQAWMVRFRNPGWFAGPRTFTVHDVQLIINEPYDYSTGEPYDPADDPNPSTGGTGSGPGGSGNTGGNPGDGGVGPVATGASHPPGSGGTGGLPGGSSGGIVYPAHDGLPSSRDVDGLVFVATTMFRPDGTGGDALGRIVDFSDGSIEIPVSDMRTGKMTVKTDSPLANLVKARETMIQTWFRGVLVGWGVAVTRATDFSDGTRVISFRDPTIRLESHFLRAGDIDSVMTTSSDPVPVYVNGQAMRLLRDAANNTTDQDVENYPVLGVGNGVDTATDTAMTVEVQRGAQVWNSMKEMAGHYGLEFRLRPVSDVAGSYVLLDTVPRLGKDRSAKVAFHKGFGLDNLDGLLVTEGAKLITHAHVLDAGLKYRFTEANTTSAQQFGVHTEWDATDFDAEHASEAAVEAALRARGDLILSAYSRPLIEVDMTPRPGAAARFLYLRDFEEGDTVAWAGKSGNVTEQGTARIMKVTLTDPGNQIVSQTFDAVGPGVPDSEIGIGDDA